MTKLTTSDGTMYFLLRDRVVRLLPPLILTTQEADEIVKLLAPLIKAFNAESA
jgi:acetylornithine aminotransferase